jgi:membrane protease YdiL (CAAX protease family)
MDGDKDTKLNNNIYSDTNDENISKNKLSPNKNEKRFITFLSILAIIGILFFGYSIFDEIQKSNITQDGEKSFFSKVIPKEEAVNIAKSFLNSNDFNIDGYDYSISLYSEPESDAFLKRNIGYEESYKYVESNNLSEASYDVRFFKDSEINEVSVGVDLESGKVVFVNNIIPENENRPELDKDSAQQVVNTFLASLNYNIEDFEERDYSTNKVQNRLDHTFRFKLKDSNIDSSYGEAYTVIRADVLGDKIGIFNYYLFVPEEFTREINQSSSAGTLLTILSALATLFMFILAIVFLVKAFINKKAAWKSYLYLAIVTVVLLGINHFNEYSILKSLYTTDTPFAVSMGILILLSIIGSIVVAASIFIAGVAGNYLSELVWKDRLKASFYNLPQSILKGYLIAFFTLGMVQFIYFIGEKYLGVWSLVDISMGYNFLIGYIPFISSFTIVFLAAFSEEIIFRLFGVSVFKKYFKSTFVAVLISALIWAVAHSDYPVFPFYFRAIELLIGGTIWGYFFIRYDLATLISAHYVYNAFIFGSAMFFLGTPHMIISAIILVLFPLILIPAYNLIKNRK